MFEYTVSIRFRVTSSPHPTEAIHQGRISETVSIRFRVTSSPHRNINGESIGNDPVSIRFRVTSSPHRRRRITGSQVRSRFNPLSRHILSPPDILYGGNRGNRQGFNPLSRHILSPPRK